MSVYFIQGEKTRLVKIGMANDVEARLRDLQAQSPDKLTILAVIGVEHDDGPYHAKFARSWSHAEWFHPTPKLMNFIAQLPSSRYSGLQVSIRNHRCADIPRYFYLATSSWMPPTDEEWERQTGDPRWMRPQWSYLPWDVGTGMPVELVSRRALNRHMAQYLDVGTWPDLPVEPLQQAA